VYLLLKAVHVLAVVLFLGNIVTGIFWKAHGDRTGDPRIMAHTLDGIIRSDRWFTIPGVVLIGLDLESDQLLVLSAHQQPSRAAADLVEVINKQRSRREENIIPATANRKHQ